MTLVGVVRQFIKQTLTEFYSKMPWRLGSGDNSIDLNKQNQALGICSVAEGYLTTALGQYSHAEGYSTNKSPNTITSSTSYNDIKTAWSNNKFSLAQKNGSHVEGEDNLALGNSSHAEGEYTKATGNSSHAEGSGTTASGDSSHAEGSETDASGVNSHAEGSETDASGVNSHAEGNVTSASGNSSHAEGTETSASGDYSHSEGSETTASGDSSHAEGEGTKASGNHSHAEGYRTRVSGDSSHAEGYSTSQAPNSLPTEKADIINLWNSNPFSLAWQRGSHVEGEDNLALGECSHAECHLSKAIGGNAHAEGNRTTASGSNSHAEGNNTSASGQNSHAEGDNNEATNPSEHAEGQFNKSNTGTRHSVGIGTSISDRKNAFEIMSDGSAFFYHIGNYNGTNPANANSLQTVIATLLAEINNLKLHETKTYHISDSCLGDNPDAFFNFFENEGSYVIHDSEFIEFFIDLLRGKHPRLIFTIMHSDGNDGTYPEAVFEVEYLYHPILTESQYYTGTTSIRALFKIPYANTSSIIGSSSSGENSIYCNLALSDNAIEVSNVTKQKIYDFSNNSNI